MKQFYTNTQRFYISGRFSVAQRKTAWLIKRHPKAFQKLRGRCWTIVRTYPNLAVAPTHILELLKEDADEQLKNLCTRIYNINVERRKRRQERLQVSHGNILDK